VLLNPQTQSQPPVPDNEVGATPQAAAAGPRADSPAVVETRGKLSQVLPGAQELRVYDMHDTHH
jgi:hypothetical protein